MTVHHPLSRQRDVSRGIVRALAMAKDYADDNTIDTIAATYGVSRGTVYRVAHRFGLSRMATQKEAREKRNEEILARLEAGASLRTIAADFDMSEANVSRIASANNKKRYKALWHGREEEIKADYNAGMKIAAIAAKYQITEGRHIYNVLKAIGVTANRLPRKEKKA